MTYEVTDIEITDKLKELTIELPTEVTFFPENFETVENKDQFIFTESMVNLTKIFKHNNINVSALNGDTELYRSRKSAEVFLPAIFFSLAQISQNPDIVSICMNIVSDYVSDFLKGVFGKKTVQVDCYIETKEKGRMKKISYKGDVQGLKELNKIVKNL